MIYLEALVIMIGDLHWTQWSPWQIYIWGCLGLVAHWHTFIREHPSLYRFSFLSSLGWMLAFFCGPLILWENRKSLMNRSEHRVSRG